MSKSDRPVSAEITTDTERVFTCWVISADGRAEMYCNYRDMGKTRLCSAEDLKADVLDWLDSFGVTPTREDQNE